MQNAQRLNVDAVVLYSATNEVVGVGLGGGIACGSGSGVFVPTMKKSVIVVVVAEL